MPVAAGKAVVKLGGGGSKLQTVESGEGSTAKGSLLGTTPHFSRSFSYTEGAVAGQSCMLHLTQTLGCGKLRHALSVPQHTGSCSHIAVA